MFKSRTAKVAFAGALAIALVGGSVSAASAAIVPSGSSSEFYLLDTNAQPIADGTTLQWNQQVIGYPRNTNTDSEPYAYFEGPASATGVSLFLSNRGEESFTPASGDTRPNSSSWIGKQTNAFESATSKRVLYPSITLENLAGVNYGAVKQNGGSFSLGLGYTSSNGILVEDVQFVHIVVQPGGAWTFQATKNSTDPEPEEPAAEGSIDLEATTIAAQDGTLSLSVPAGAKATFGEAILVNGKSTSVATLPEVTVTDERVVTQKGWTLTQSVADFVNGSNVIAATNLGIAPKVVSAGTTATGVTAAAAQVAGSATYPAPFAGANAGAGVGVTKLGADLTLVAPVDAPAGTYTSKLTLTLVSK